MEINQAGLSWATILKKRPAFRAAFADFEVDRVAVFGSDDVERLMSDSGIVRNRLKIAAVIDNARRIQGLRREFGSFANWLDANHPLCGQDITFEIQILKVTAPELGPAAPVRNGALHAAS